MMIEKSAQPLRTVEQIKEKSANIASAAIALEKLIAGIEE
jgi:phosphoglycerate-specific signal transduction histidine kinase